MLGRHESTASSSTPTKFAGRPAKNNPLNFAITGLFTLRKKGQSLAPEQQGDYTEVLNDVEEGVKRVKTIVSDLQMFSHPETESRDQVEVAEVIASALRFLSNEWKDKVQIDQEIAGIRRSG